MQRWESKTRLQGAKGRRQPATVKEVFVPEPGAPNRLETWLSRHLSWVATCQMQMRPLFIAGWERQAAAVLTGIRLD